jgi:Zn-dependent M28 family amino/carboxypeptidase
MKDRRFVAVRPLPLILACMAAICAMASCGAEDRSGAGVAAAPATVDEPALAADSTGGFDGARAYQHVADLVAMGSRTAGTPGNQRAREYIVDKLQGFGCVAEQQPFRASTAIGSVAMTNIIAKIRGADEGVLMFATHYDTLRMQDFVGADDGGSSTGVMLELARRLCQRRNALNVWILFFDGEEAFQQWSATDGTYGSRELAARLALSGEIKRIKAMVLADLVGSRSLRLPRESNSTAWLTDLVWATAARLGYGEIFVQQSTYIEDDHLPFLRRGVPAVDIVRCCSEEIPYWHTPQDTLDKISPRSLAIVGHVLIEVLPQLERRFGSE